MEQIQIEKLIKDIEALPDWDLAHCGDTFDSKGRP